MKKNRQFYIVSAEILPEAMVKTALAKELLAKGEAETIKQAVDQVELSRSAFYKYRDGIFPFYQERKEQIVTLNIILDHRFGILSGVINTIASVRGNILTINQSIPLQGMANVTVSLETAQMRITVPELLECFLAIPGVLKVELVGQSI
ncbi:MAG: ACT domain-containing protein [Dehalobacterium sp.]|jgi:chorismate mutase